jgi:hypothetical protein
LKVNDEQKIDNYSACPLKESQETLPYKRTTKEENKTS